MLAIVEVHFAKPVPIATAAKLKPWPLLLAAWPRSSESEGGMLLNSADGLHALPEPVGEPLHRQLFGILAEGGACQVIPS